jgi:hypothetical protein
MKGTPSFCDLTPWVQGPDHSLRHPNSFHERLQGDLPSLLALTSALSL